MRVLFSLSLTLGLGMLMPLPAEASQRCVTLAQTLQELPYRTHYEVIEGDPATKVISLLDLSGTRLATLVYRTQGDTILLDSIQVESGHRNQGHSKRLFAELLRREPEAMVIESSLMKDNLAAALNGEPHLPRRKDEAECIRMVTRTPAYRARAHFGFTRILECSFGPGSIILRVGRAT